MDDKYLSHKASKTCFSLGALQTVIYGELTTNTHTYSLLIPSIILKGHWSSTSEGGTETVRKIARFSLLLNLTFHRQFRSDLSFNCSKIESK